MDRKIQLPTMTTTGMACDGAACTTAKLESSLGAWQLDERGDGRESVRAPIRCAHDDHETTGWFGPSCSHAPHVINT